MDTEKLNQELYDKMAAEQEQFKQGLLGLTAEEALNHAYEFTIREDILMAMEFIELPASQASALLSSPSPLADIFKDFRDMETGHMDYVKECIGLRAEEILDVQREAIRAIPLYKENVRYAKEHGELDLFCESQATNIACRNAIDAAIQDGYDGSYLHVDAIHILKEFGPERVSHVLAASLLDKPWDQRISRDNKAWAASVPMFDTGNRHHDYVIHSHSLLLDGFVHAARKEMDAMQKQEEKKPSIKKQLAVKPAPSDQPAKPKEREGR